MSVVVAIDGPAASGKGTLARRLAAEYGFHHLDTGLTYRAVAKALMDNGAALDDPAAAENMARKLDLAAMNRGVLSAHEVGEAASKIAVMPEVRRVLVQKQREFADRMPGAVLDGRDIGTVVCPDAAIKLFVTASAEVRAARRHAEIIAGGGDAELDDILADIRRRDARDMARADSPLKPAPDAHLLDTSEMDIETAFRTAKTLVDKALAARKQENR